MRKLNNTELLSVNGGDKTLYEKVRDFVNNNLGDLVKGIRDEMIILKRNTWKSWKRKWTYKNRTYQDTIRKSLWFSIVCALAIIVGFGILLNMDDVFDNPGEKQTAIEEKYEK